MYLVVSIFLCYTLSFIYLFILIIDLISSACSFNINKCDTLILNYIIKSHKALNLIETNLTNINTNQFGNNNYRLLIVAVIIK